MSILRLVQYENDVLPVILQTGTQKEIDSFITLHDMKKIESDGEDSKSKYYFGKFRDALGINNPNSFRYCEVLTDKEQVTTCEENIENILNVICDINWSITAQEPSKLDSDIIFGTQLLFTSDGYTHKINYLGIEIYCSENEERIYYEEIDNYELFETYLKRRMTEVHQTFPKIEFIHNLMSQT